MSLYVPVVIGSIRLGRNTPRLARLLESKLRERADTTPELIDLAEYDLPMLRERLRYLEDPPDALVRLGEHMRRADALVIVSPEYNKGYPAALKNALDALGSELRRKPVGIACHSTGAFGGSVVLQRLRPVLMNLGAVPIPASMTIPHIATAIAEDGTPQVDEHGGRAERFLDELAWYGRALKAARGAGE